MRVSIDGGAWPGAAYQPSIGTVAEGGGKLTTLPADQLAWLRRDLLGMKLPDDLLWALRWLRQEKHCDPAIYADLIRTPSMKRKMEALNAGGR